MGIDLSEGGRGYEDLLRHAGHKIVCVRYGNGPSPYTVAIECETCGKVLVSFDNPGTFCRR